MDPHPRVRRQGAGATTRQVQWSPSVMSASPQRHPRQGKLFSDHVHFPLLLRPRSGSCRSLCHCRQSNTNTASPGSPLEKGGGASRSGWFRTRGALVTLTARDLDPSHVIAPREACSCAGPPREKESRQERKARYAEPICETAFLLCCWFRRAPREPETLHYLRITHSHDKNTRDVAALAYKTRPIPVLREPHPHT